MMDILFQIRLELQIKEAVKSIPFLEQKLVLGGFQLA
jgi:hypothetical protein